MKGLLLIRKALPALLIVLLTVLLNACGGGGDGDGGDINTAPVANAGRDMNVLNNALVVLDGNASSDADGDLLTYEWAIVSKPAGSAAILSEVSDVEPTFTTDVIGTYTISLAVYDGVTNSPPDTVSFTAISSVSLIHDTGQDKCYDNSAELGCPNNGEAFYGQDAHYSTNPLRFVDNGSTVTDSLINLTWQKADDGRKYNWYLAAGVFDATYNSGTVDVCGTVSLGGYSDWRLPSRRELVSIVNYTQNAADTAYFQSSGSDYWTSTTTSVGSDVAWGVTDGRVTYGFGSKGTSSLYVRCVRGSSWGQNSLTDNGDGSVTDNMSGLIWQQNDDAVARNWEEALAYCENLTLAGYSGWRLPDIKELESLVYIDSLDNALYAPSVNTTYFPTTQHDDYWSSTTYLTDWSSTTVWNVDFALGWVEHGHSDKENFLFSRCVR